MLLLTLLSILPFSTSHICPALHCALPSLAYVKSVTLNSTPCSRHCCLNSIRGEDGVALACEDGYQIVAGADVHAGFAGHVYCNSGRWSAAIGCTSTEPRGKWWRQLNGYTVAIIGVLVSICVGLICAALRYASIIDLDAEQRRSGTAGQAGQTTDGDANRLVELFQQFPLPGRARLDSPLGPPPPYLEREMAGTICDEEPKTAQDISPQSGQDDRRERSTMFSENVGVTDKQSAAVRSKPSLLHWRSKSAAPTSLTLTPATASLGGDRQESMRKGSRRKSRTLSQIVAEGKARLEQRRKSTVAAMTAQGRQQAASGSQHPFFTSDFRVAALAYEERLRESFESKQFETASSISESIGGSTPVARGPLPRVAGMNRLKSAQMKWKAIESDAMVLEEDWETLKTAESEDWEASKTAESESD